MSIKELKRALAPHCYWSVVTLLFVSVACDGGAELNAVKAVLGREPVKYWIDHEIYFAEFYRA